MGWTFPYTTRTRSELVRYLRRPERFGPRLELVRACVKGSHHWYLIREKESGLHWVGLDLMTGARVDGWGYKDLDETVGPTAIDCPLSYLDAPHREPVGYAAEWRNRVRRFHAGTSRPQADADARLIAAAPELLAVLVGIERSMGWLVDNPDEPLIMSRSDFDAVRAAIRKATGE